LEISFKKLSGQKRSWMIRRWLGDRTCCITTPKGALISADAGAGVITQPTPGSPNLLFARAGLALRVGCVKRRKKTPGGARHPCLCRYGRQGARRNATRCR